MPHTLQFDAALHDIDHVVVYQANRAEVTRCISVELKQGQNDIEIFHLPTALQADFLRVEGLGKATLLDVIYSTSSSATSL